MENYKVSLIIPVYNSENFIGHTIESIVRSIYLNYELIIVDDCSTDNTPAILDEYASKYDKISVYHLPENHHQAYARKYGFLQSTGDWIWFIDADDTITEYAISLFISRIEQYKENKNIDIDIVIGQTYINAEGEYSKYYPTEWLKNKIIGPKEECLYDSVPDKFVNDNLYNSYLWQNCLWKRCLLANPLIDWAENVYYNEDTILMYLLYYYANNILYLPFVTYCYNVINNGGCLVNFKNKEKEAKNTMYKHYAYMFVYFFLKRKGIPEIFFKQETICSYFTSMYFLIKTGKIKEENEKELFRKSCKMMQTLCTNFIFNFNELSYKENLEELIKKI